MGFILFHVNIYKGFTTYNIHKATVHKTVLMLKQNLKSLKTLNKILVNDKR